MVLDHQKIIDCPIVVSLYFHVLFKLFPGTVFRGSQCRICIKHMFLVPFLIFMIFKNAPFENYFRIAGHQQPMTPNSGERPCRGPAFHETIVITVPLGHRGLKKYMFSTRLAHFLFLLRFFVLCVI